MRVYPKVSGLSYDEINNNKHSLRSNKMVIAAKLTRLTHKTAIKLHTVTERCTICSSRSTRPVRKLLDTPSYFPNNRLCSKVTAREDDVIRHEFWAEVVPLIPNANFLQSRMKETSLVTCSNWWCLSLRMINWLTRFITLCRAAMELVN
jgi:hypothetical protein